MMFIIHAAFALTLLTLTAGAALYIWSVRNQGKGSTLGRIVGFFVVLVSALSVICSFYLGIKIWKEIYYINVMQMQSAPMQNPTPANAPKEHHHRK